MPDHQLDHHLLPWEEIHGEAWKALLLGNGFSINIWQKFQYKSLFDVAKSADIEPALDANSVILFTKLSSSNFEDVLRVLYHARLVDEQLGSPQQASIDALYTNTKNGLAAAVNFSHVPHGFEGLAAINSAFRSFSNVFTTNYDLIPYWAIMQSETWRFKDLFWGDENTFDPGNTEVNADRCVISYLHGAIHLVELPGGKTKKLVANASNSLSELFDLAHPEYFPLFISEGSSEKKLSRIKRNDYLRFSFEKFQSADGNLVVLGHSLNKDYDQHLIDALRDGSFSSIAIGVWPHQTPEQILLFKSRIIAEVRNKKVYFFDSTTHPLGSVELRHEA